MATATPTTQELPTTEELLEAARHADLDLSALLQAAILIATGKRIQDLSARHRLAHITRQIGARR